MNHLHYLSIKELAQLIESRQVSSEEVTQALLDRIATHDSRLQAYALVTAEDALTVARCADRELARGRYLGPLHGVPIALKDLCCVRGIRTAGGTAVLSDFIPDFDATVVTKLRSAGAVILGKLNLAEGAMAAYSPRFAAPYNPWVRTISPGGSSSGSGVATATGMCFGSLGTDTGGSIRFPASMCGVVGLKPTWGRVSRYGVLDLAPSMDHVGTLTRTVSDAATMMDIIAGADDKDSTTMSSTVNFAAALNAGVSGLRIGYAEQYATMDVDDATAEAVAAALTALAARGATVVGVDMPSLDEYLPAWRDLCATEAFIAHEQYFPSRASEYGPWFRSWLNHGMTRSASDYASAHQRRLECNAVVARAFATIDVLLCPAMAAPEPRKSDEENFTLPMGEFNAVRQRFTIPYNFNGAPSVTVPAGYNEDAAPIGVQCVAKPGGDDLALRAARAIEQSHEATIRHPPLFP